MKREWDLIRNQLTTIEDEKDIFAEVKKLSGKQLADESDEKFKKRREEAEKIEDRFLGHLRLLVENDYIDGVTVSRGLSGDWIIAHFKPRLTMAGHDLLDTIRSETVWATIKETAKKKGLELTFESIKALGTYALKQVIGG